MNDQETIEAEKRQAIREEVRFVISEAYKCQAEQIMDHIRELEDAIKRMLPIVHAAYYDKHTAGCIPGSGYDHKAQHLAGQLFGWRDSSAFEAFEARLKNILSDKE